jgi:hypothetical protein
MVATLLLEPYGIAALTQSFAQSGAKALAIDVFVPEPQLVQSGSYLLSRPILLVSQAHPPTQVKQFIDLISSPRDRRSSPENSSRCDDLACRSDSMDATVVQEKEAMFLTKFLANLKVRRKFGLLMGLVMAGFAALLYTAWTSRRSKRVNWRSIHCPLIYRRSLMRWQSSSLPPPKRKAST